MLLASYAKINLHLEVLSKRQDNYHQIETLLCSVSLSDTIKYALTKNRGIKLWSNQPELVSDSNLICKVAKHLELMFQPKMGLEIELNKRIPIAAGLGGGSSNAACTIVALNKLWSLNLNLEKQLSIAASFGSDIAFFLYGGTCWATGRGEILNPLPDMSINNILLVNPNLEISSAKAYSLVQPPEPEERQSFDAKAWRHCCYNRLEPGIRAEYPAVEDIIDLLARQGANPAMMSGSGSTCFGIFDDEAAMTFCQKLFKDMGYWTQTVRSVSRKEYHGVFETKVDHWQCQS